MKDDKDQKVVYLPWEIYKQQSTIKNLGEMFYTQTM